MQGKTDEAKADLSRLAKVRAEREAAQAKRIAEANGKHVLLYDSVLNLTRTDSTCSQSCGSRGKEESAACETYLIRVRRSFSPTR